MAAEPALAPGESPRGGAAHALERIEADTELRRFAQALADELRVPITAIAGFGKVLGGLLDGAAGEAGDRPRHYVERIRAAGAQLQEYVDALGSLTVATPSEVRLADVDLSVIARAVAGDLRKADPGRAVAVSVQPGLRAWGDQLLLRIVVENLLANAWKFTGARAAAEISVRGEAASGRQTVVHVEDNGVGFDPDYADKLFQDFKRLHSQAEFPGAGLGLANVRRIVSRHGGRVWASSRPGEGATFSFMLPVPARAGVAAAPSTHRALAGGAAAALA